MLAENGTNLPSVSILVAKMFAMIPCVSALVKSEALDETELKVRNWEAVLPNENL